MFPLGDFHSVRLPVSRRTRRWLFWPPQDPLAVRTCGLDCTRWMADADTYIVGAGVKADAPLLVSGLAWDGALVSVTITGGIPQTVPIVLFALLLASGNTEAVEVRLPILPLDPAMPPGFSVLGGDILTLGGDPLALDGVFLTLRG